ncbi:amidase family protein [Limnohabitans sp. WS1]|uniref:amidase family protein n=1 Tax=Limnohabitans sp. WS1 TaxID=1100726 RepID=UPI000D3C6F63|nr:amidase family protein [Limnohabitans sp. WS1]PUE21363.1 amidase [Limnohabitans sp. WS1]
MATTLWQLSATELAARIARRETTARAATESVLARIAEVNPQVNALASVSPDKALQAADAADAAQTRGDVMGPLHGVPVTIKINIDVQGEATDEGVHDFKDNIASSDSPLVQSLREAGAIVVGRNNAPAFSLRWFTDNDLHGRTLNPFDAGVTPGGSSGGAAVATALGMGAIAHGNDYGGSIRYPAWACGVVGLRTTVGRVPSYKASAPNRIISNQQMSVQGPLTRTVADARLALQVMAQGTPLDPQWVPAPLEFADAQQPCRVAVFRNWAHSAVDPTVSAAVDQAARWLEAAGYTVEEVEPPHFAEVSAMQFHMVMNDMRRGGEPFMREHGDDALRKALSHYMAINPVWDRDQYLEAMTRRFNIARDWAVFLERYPVLLMPNSWERQFPIDDDQRSAERTAQILLAQAPLLSTATLGLPGLSVPTGVVNGLPVGVQIVSTKFREDRMLAAGEVIEQAAQFSALAYLRGRG